MCDRYNVKYVFYAKIFAVPSPPFLNALMQGVSRLNQSKGDTKSPIVFCCFYLVYIKERQWKKLYVKEKNFPVMCCMRNDRIWTG